MMNPANFRTNFTETVNTRSGNWIKSLSDDALGFITWTDDYSETENKRYLKSIRTYMGKILDGNGSLDRQYGNATGKQFIPGRIYVREGLGLQSCIKNIRSLLCRDIYTDIDMVNCHPCLFKYLANESGCPTPLLEDYIQNRDKRLDENDVTKYDMLKIKC